MRIPSALAQIETTTRQYDPGPKVPPLKYRKASQDGQMPMLQDCEMDTVKFWGFKRYIRILHPGSKAQERK